NPDGSAGASPPIPFVTLSVSEGSQMLRLRLSMTGETARREPRPPKLFVILSLAPNPLVILSASEESLLTV
ncbi:MAG: hypothetical protein NZ749_14445, partial [bacterium]|nr:hypothetical protein [bacterium]